MNRSSVQLVSVAFSMAGIIISDAAAGESPALPEVIVTAQKREQSQSKVGISLTALTGDELAERGVKSTADLDTQTPGLIVGGFGGGSTTAFTIRGAGQLDFNDQQEAPVAVYQDGVYNSYLAGGGFRVFDVQRIEVLRGSQGTLFGRNATAGLVQIISRKPSDKSEGYVDLTVGQYGERRLEAAVGGPLTRDLDGRISVLREQSSGYIKNPEPNGYNSGGSNNFSARAQLLWKPSGSTSVLVNGRWASDDAHAQLYYELPAVTSVGNIPGVPNDGLVRLANPAQHLYFCANVAPEVFGMITIPVLGATDCHGNFAGNDPFSVASDGPSTFRRTSWGATATVTSDTAIGTVTSITNYDSLTKRYLEDSDSSVNYYFQSTQNLGSHQFSQELRLEAVAGRNTWVGGLYYLNIIDGGLALLDTFPTYGAAAGNHYDLNTRSYAAFSQFERKLTDSLTAIAGARWTEDQKRFELDPLCTFNPHLAGLNRADCLAAFGASGLVQATGIPSTSTREGNWSANLELDWQTSDTWFAYAKLTRGYKAGGFNGGLGSFFLPGQETYGGETPRTAEMGVKGAFADNRARLSADVFYTDYRDFQTFAQAGPSLYVFNIDAVSKGGEFELTALPLQHLEIYTGLSLLEATARKLAGPDGVRDRPMPNAPHATVNFGIRYSLSTRAGTFIAQSSLRYVGRRSLAAIDSPALQASPYSVLQAGITWKSNDERWKASITANNLTDKIYYRSGFDATSVLGVVQYVAGAPRTVLTNISYSW